MTKAPPKIVTAAGSDKKAKAKKKQAVSAAAPKSWDQRITKKADKSERTVLAAVGKALSAWAQLEVNLARLFATISMTSGHSESAALIAFGSVRTFEGRSEMLGAVSSWFFYIQRTLAVDLNDINYGTNAVKEIESAFGEVLKDANRYVARRNELAHGLVLRHNVKLVGNSQYINLKSPRYTLRPTYIEMKKHINFQTPKFAYGSTEIKEYTKEFGRISAEANSLNVKIRGMLLSRR